MAFLFDTKEELEEKQARRAPRSSAALGRAVGADTEIALGTRSLLGIFFGLVLICSIFFGLGYSVGRAGGSRAAVQPPDLAPTPDSHISKPSAEQTLTPVEQPPAKQSGVNYSAAARAGSSQRARSARARRAIRGFFSPLLARVTAPSGKGGNKLKFTFIG